MKPIERVVSITPAANQHFTDSLTRSNQLRDPRLQLAEADFEPLRQILAGLQPGPGQDELILELRTEAKRLLPCDRVCIALGSDNLLQVFEHSDGKQSTVLPQGTLTCMTWLPKQPRFLLEDTADALRAASGVQASFTIDSGAAGSVSFLSNVAGAFHSQDLIRAQRIADFIGLILRKSGSRNGRESNSVPEGDWRANLLAALCEVPDVHRILPRISLILQDVIPHDRLTVSFHDRDRFMSMKSVSNPYGPTFERVQVSKEDFPRDGTSLIINDLESHHPAMEPYHFLPQAVDAGYRSFLVNHVWCGNHGLGLVFWSKRCNGFQISDVPVAQRLAELCSVAVSREHPARIETREKLVEPATPRMIRPNANEVNFATPVVAGVPGLPGQVSQSAAWQDVLRSVRQVAATDTTVLLIGETGSGKEVVARLIYSQSSRRTAPFIAVNCAALPDGLLESELFGFERGAFTGAYQHKRGHIEAAARGVLFLDEISEMSLSAQAKILRVLETREFQPLGSTRPRKAEIRIVAASNRDLQQEIRAGRFRADLYYRLCVFRISLPPLRARRQDIIPLAYHFISEVGSSADGPLPRLSADAEAALLNYHWPGNVRELRNVIERALILCPSDEIAVEHIMFQTDLPDGEEPNHISTVERSMIERVMRECGGNKARAARMLGLSRTQLYVRLKRYFDPMHFSTRA